jgi:predicted RND superfamily exporter protein
MWSLRTQTPAQVSREIGPVGLVAVALIACGFFVMALGRSPITRLFGTLAGISTVLSAALTCVVLPVVLRVWRRSRGRGHA